MRGLFITGTDTGIGKTWLGCALARALHEAGVRVIPRKPVESGCLPGPRGLIPEDADLLARAAQYRGDLEQVCPWRFAEAISPRLAARQTGRPLHLKQLLLASQPDGRYDDEFLLVEGAGGFYSPLCEDGLNADLAQALELPLLLVGDDRLGGVNQVLLAAEAIRHRGLQLLAVALNQPRNSADQPAAMDNRRELADRLPAPVYTVKHSTTQIPDELLNLILETNDLSRG